VKVAGAWPPDISATCISDLLSIRFSLASGLYALGAYVVCCFHVLGLLLSRSNTQITSWQFSSWLCCQQSAGNVELKPMGLHCPSDAALSI